MHRDHQAVRAPVGKELRVMKVSSAKDGSDPHQRGICKRTHIRRDGGEPGLLVPDLRISWSDSQQMLHQAEVHTVLHVV